jgi:hypothetical protein
MRIIILAHLMVFYTPFLVSQERSNYITINVKSQSGYPVENAIVFFCSQSDCQNSTSDVNGNTYFTQPIVPTAIIAYDPSGKYGVHALKVEQSCGNYSIKLPDKPKNPREAGTQFDCIFNKISELYGYYDSGVFIGESIKIISNGAGSLGSIAFPVLGINGVFSINPIPTIGYDGKLGLQVSGVLADKLIELWKITQPLQGQRAYYQYYPSY